MNPVVGYSGDPKFVLGIPKIMRGSTYKGEPADHVSMIFKILLT
jgi:hypothetical protein